MTIKPTAKRVRYASLEALPQASELSQAFKLMARSDVERQAAADPDAGAVPPGFWDSAHISTPDGTEQITLRLPRRVISHFKATGKGYQTRISAVLVSYVEAMARKRG